METPLKPPGVVVSSEDPAQGVPSMNNASPVLKPQILTSSQGDENESEEENKDENPENQREHTKPGSKNVWEFFFALLSKSISMGLALSMDIVSSAAKGAFNVCVGALKTTAGVIAAPFDGGKLLASGVKDMAKGIGEMVAPVASVAANAVKFLPVPGAEKLGNFLSKGVDKLDPNALRITKNQMQVEFPKATAAFKGSPKPTPNNTPKKGVDKKPLAPRPKPANNEIDPSLKKRMDMAKSNSASMQKQGGLSSSDAAKKNSNTHLYDNNKKQSKVEIKSQAKPKSVANNVDKPKASAKNSPRPSPPKLK